MNWRMYLPAIVLVSMALLINVMAWFAPYTVPSAASGRKVEEMSVTDRIREAESFVELGDAAYEAGTGLWNDTDALQSAVIHYRQAWRLITDQEFPSGQERAALLVDSPQLNAMQEHLKGRFTALTEALGSDAS